MRKRKKGISLLVPTQNSEKTIELCIKSFLDFPDEIIVVDNGSKDNTINILKKLEGKIEKMKFYNVPELPDLYHNRQFALEKSSCEWIVRIDSDYVAYTDGRYNILNLRKKILDNGEKSIRPLAYNTKQVNLYFDCFHTGKEKIERDSKKGKYVTGPITTYPARIIKFFPKMRFQRIGRWEGVRFQKFLKKIELEHPYWFHCEFKSKIDYFFRSERTNWREHGNFKKYPTLESYILDIIDQKYGTNDINEACDIYMKECFFPYLVKYDPEKYYPYPDLLKKHCNIS